MSSSMHHRIVNEEVDAALEGHRIGAQLEELCFRELAWASLYIDGHRYSAGFADDRPQDELLIERDDGQKFVVEVSVDVRPA